MKTAPKYLRILIVLIPAIVFAMSLTQDALTTEHGESTTLTGVLAFLMGGTAILGGGTLEWAIWLANPIAMWACFKFLLESSTSIEQEPKLPGSKKVIPSSHWRALLAAAMGWSFSLWNNVLISESGSTSKIISLEPGYWLWVSSLTLLALGINYYHYAVTLNKTSDI